MTAKRTIIILAMLACPCMGAEINVELAVTAARMLDVERGVIIRNPFIVVENGLIKSVSTTPSSSGGVVYKQQ